MRDEKSQVVYEDAGKLTGRLLAMVKMGDSEGLARLREGVGFNLVLPLIHNEHNRRHAEEVALMTARAFGISRQYAKIGSLGSSMRRLWLDLNKSDGFEAMACRVMASRDRQVMEQMLLPIVMRLAKERVPIDFYKLYIDLYYWGDVVRKRWASDFYKPQINRQDKKGTKS